MTKAIEKDFPFEQIDKVAERESWRKEIYRPIYYIHKWWARRLGSVFRALTLGALLEDNSDIWSQFYQKHSFGDKVVLDPFMGSGTTIGESIKLGAKVVGCDINPLSSFIVRQSLTNIKIDNLHRSYKRLEKNIKNEIQSYYTSIDPKTGRKLKVLYYFWVKLVKTPEGNEIPLFSNYIFSKHVYPKKNPEAQIICPECWDIFEDRYDSKSSQCSNCLYEFNPKQGPAKRTKIFDEKSGKWHKIIDLIRANEDPPKHRMYAFLALNEEGEKQYYSISKYDLKKYANARAKLKEIESDLPLPNASIISGTNTDQVINYNYQNWRDFFNYRQLLCLGLLYREILKEKKKKIREHLLCLFSSILEFNNMFCTFKGEGTGAVRPLFSSHILKPERTPLENSIWGYNKGSGTFQALFKSRLLKAKKYLNNPFDLKLTKCNGKYKSNKVTCSDPINGKITSDPEDFKKGKSKALILNGDSSTLPIEEESVDAVVTDPPFFDFINYSELSDFFYAWLKEGLADEYNFFERKTSRREEEVQNNSAEVFSDNLSKVLRECYRVLKRNGLLIFSFHHSKIEGWLSVYNAIKKSNFKLVSSHPVKSELSVATHKSATKQPINLDSILVCKKKNDTKAQSIIWIDVIKNCFEKLKDLIQRFESANRNLGMGDKKIILISTFLVELSQCSENVIFSKKKLTVEQMLKNIIDMLEDGYFVTSPEKEQMYLFGK